MKTENGIYLNLDESTYIFKKCGLIFFFSSKFYLEKFKSNVENYVNNETLKLKNRYKGNINFNIYLSLAYYRKIEKRGYKVIDELSKKQLKQESLIINSIIF